MVHKTYSKTLFNEAIQLRFRNNACVKKPVKIFFMCYKLNVVTRIILSRTYTLVKYVGEQRSNNNAVHKGKNNLLPSSDSGISAILISSMAVSC